MAYVSERTCFHMKYSFSFSFSFISLFHLFCLINQARAVPTEYERRYFPVRSRASLVYKSFNIVTAYIIFQVPFRASSCFSFIAFPWNPYVIIFHNSSINKFSLFQFTNLLNAHEFAVDKDGMPLAMRSMTGTMQLMSAFS